MRRQRRSPPTGSLIRPHAATGSGVLVALGGDVAVAVPAPDAGWPVLVGRPSTTRRVGSDGVDPRGRPGHVEHDRATVAGRRGGLHHVVNPANGAPAAETWRTVSVAAATCVDANVAATAAIVRGDGALAWLDSLGLDARLVGADGAVARTARWPEEASFSADSQVSLARWSP